MIRKANTPAMLKDEGGFALAMAVFALVVLAAVVAGGYFSASQEFQIGRSMRSATSSFYAGEMGIVRVLETWDHAAAEALNPGDTFPVSGETLVGGGNYTANVVRIDDGGTAGLRYYYIESTGRPPSPTRGERRQAIVARARIPNLCCTAAVTTSGGTDLGGGGGTTKVYGNDVGVLPPGWDAACVPYPRQDLAALRITHADSIDNLARLDGTPDYIEDPSLTKASVPNLGELTYNELVQFADFTFPDSTSFTDSNPTTVGGKCDKEDPDNWGAPNNPSHVCFDHFPIIHVTGDLNLSGPGSAQGILLVDDDINISGLFEFYGIMIIKDDLHMSGGADIFGGVYVAENLEIQSTPARIYHTNCAVERAVRNSNLARPMPIPGRAWVELF